MFVKDLKFIERHVALCFGDVRQFWYQFCVSRTIGCFIWCFSILQEAFLNTSQELSMTRMLSVAVNSWVPGTKAEDEKWIVGEFNCSCVGISRCLAAYCKDDTPNASWDDISAEDKAEAGLSLELIQLVRNVQQTNIVIIVMEFHLELDFWIDVQKGFFMCKENSCQKFRVRQSKVQRPKRWATWWERRPSRSSPSELAGKWLGRCFTLGRVLSEAILNQHFLSSFFLLLFQPPCGASEGEASGNTAQSAYSLGILLWWPSLSYFPHIEGVGTPVARSNVSTRTAKRRTTDVTSGFWPFMNIHFTIHGTFWWHLTSERSISLHRCGLR